jgi:hypothetical protein
LEIYHHAGRILSARVQRLKLNRQAAKNVKERGVFRAFRGLDFFAGRDQLDFAISKIIFEVALFMPRRHRPGEVEYSSCPGVAWRLGGSPGIYFFDCN